MKKNIILDVNYHYPSNTLILAILLLETGKTIIKQIKTDKTFSLQKRNRIIEYFNSVCIYTFREGCFIDSLFSIDNFVDDFFILNKESIKELKKEFSSEKSNKAKYTNKIISKNFVEFYPKYQSGDLKVLGLFAGIKQEYSMFDSIESAINYNKINLSIIFFLFTKWKANSSCFDKIKNIKNCYGNLICLNGTCVISPRVINVKGAWLSSNYYYFTTNNNKSQVKNMQEFTINFINENKNKKNWEEKFKNEIKNYIQQNIQQEV